jgi:hypothetical protein
MNPEDPESAQRIVAEYASVLERESEAEIYPSSVSSLPYPKPTIKAAIRTCVRALAATDQLTPELSDFLEIAYVSLADYVDEDIVQLLTEFREASATLAADERRAREKVGTPAWNRLRESSQLAGDIARMIAEQTESLRQEFQEFRQLPV